MFITHVLSDEGERRVKKKKFWEIILLISFAFFVWFTFFFFLPIVFCCDTFVDNLINLLMRFLTIIFTASPSEKPTSIFFEKMLGKWFYHHFSRPILRNFIALGEKENDLDNLDNITPSPIILRLNVWITGKKAKAVGSQSSIISTYKLNDFNNETTCTTCAS